jgi:hypothetical protein
MKKLSFLLYACFMTLFVFGQETKELDSTAIYILDKMSDNIGNLESVTFDLSNSIDEFDDQRNIVTQFSTSTITFSGPDKLLIRTDGTKGKLGYWFDGTYVTYYSYDENNYVTLDAPDNTIEMIESMHERFNFDFPAADFFYPSLTDDMILQFDSITFLGTKVVHGEECYHIMATNDKINVQLWISNESFLLPKHFVVIYKDKSNIQYESTFSNWSINPTIPDSVFSFLAPPKARLINIMEK